MINYIITNVNFIKLSGENKLIWSFGNEDTYRSSICRPKSWWYSTIALVTLRFDCLRMKRVLITLICNGGIVTLILLIAKPKCVCGNTEVRLYISNVFFCVQITIYKYMHIFAKSSFQVVFIKSIILIILQKIRIWLQQLLHAKFIFHINQYQLQWLKNENIFEKANTNWLVRSKKKIDKRKMYSDAVNESRKK